ERAAEVVAGGRTGRLPYGLRGEGGPEPDDVGGTPAGQLVGQAAGPVLGAWGVFAGMGGGAVGRRGPCPRPPPGWRDTGRRGRGADAVDVVLAVPQVAVVARAARGEDPRVLVGVGVAQVARHLLGGAQRAEIEGAAHRVRPVELDVVGVVLLSFHDAVPVRVP